MPSQLHEVLLTLFRNRPALAAELLRSALDQELPAFAEASIDSENLTEVQPAEYRADLVVRLDPETPALGIVLEVQLRRDARKRYAWPAYVASLRARLKCPVYLLVITPSELDPEVARANPELAVLSAIAHSRDKSPRKAALIAMAAQQASLGLDEGRSRLYFDLIQAFIGEAARREFQNMDPAKYVYQSEFAKRYYGQGKVEGKAEGKVEGKAEGKAEMLRRQLSLRFGKLSPADQARLSSASLEELDAIGDRLITASSLHEALGEAPGGKS